MIINNGSKLQGEVALFLAGISFGFVPIISALLRNNHVSSIEQIFMRHLVAFLFSFFVLFFLIVVKKKDQFSIALNKKVQLTYFIQGIILNLMIVVYFISISLNTPVGEAALLVQVHPIFTFIISYFWLKETIDKNKLSSLGLAIVGIIFLFRPWELASFGRYLVGDLLAMSNGLFYSLYIVVGRKSRLNRKNISSLTSNSWVMVWAFVLGLFFLYTIYILPLPPNINSFNLNIFSNSFNFFLGILLGLAGSIIPYGLLMIGFPHVESSKAAILLLGEPLAAVIFGSLLLHEPITIYYVLGGLFLFIAIIKISYDYRNNEISS